MIGSLRGVIVEFEPIGDNAVEMVLEVHGVGYRVVVGARSAAGLARSPQELGLSVHTYVREGAIVLYGFETALERRAFEALLGAHGVGPALALGILNVYAPHRLAELISTGDVDALTAVPGIGKKTAQRLIIDFGQRLNDVVGTRLVGDEVSSIGSSSRIEVREALSTLGYGTEEVRSVLDQLAGDKSVEELLRDALRELAPRS